MSVILVLLTANIIFWVFEHGNFAINMSIFTLIFAVSEWINKEITGTTITGNFWKWKKKQPAWKVWLVAGVGVAAVGYFLGIPHLIFEK